MIGIAIGLFVFGIGHPEPLTGHPERSEGSAVRGRLREGSAVLNYRFLAPLEMTTQQLERRRLPATVVIDGITCGPTGRAFAEFHPSGRLAECPLANDTVLSGQRLPATTWVSFNADGSLHGAWLPRDVELNGHLCHGTGYKGFRVLFHPSGALKLCFLAADAEIQGVPCLHGSFWTEIRGGGKSAVHFREGGHLLRCQASRKFTMDGVEVRKWQTATFDTEGRLMDPNKPQAAMVGRRLP